jgi:hypothetical protein
MRRRFLFGSICEEERQRFLSRNSRGLLALQWPGQAVGERHIRLLAPLDKLTFFHSEVDGCKTTLDAEGCIGTWKMSESKKASNFFGTCSNQISAWAADRRRLVAAVFRRPCIARGSGGFVSKPPDKKSPSW